MSDAASSEKVPTYLDNEPCCGAPPNAPWGYLKCGCSNDGFGRHAGHYGYAPKPSCTEQRDA